MTRDLEPTTLPLPWHDDLAAARVGGVPRRLPADLVDAALRGWWLAWTREAGISTKRASRVLADLDAAPQAWRRLAGLLPGAIALPARTAAVAGIERSELVLPPSTPWRLVDLYRARRLRRRLRRATPTLAAELARFTVWSEQDRIAAIADGDDGTPYAQLPPYALAARIEQLLRTTATWAAPMRVLLVAADAASRGVETSDELLDHLVEEVLGHRAALHATTSVLASALGAQLAATGQLAAADDVLDLSLPRVLVLARGGALDA